MEINNIWDEILLRGLTLNIDKKEYLMVSTMPAYKIVKMSTAQRAYIHNFV